MNIRKLPNYRAAPAQKPRSPLPKAPFQKPPPNLPEGRGMDEKANVLTPLLHNS